MHTIEKKKTFINKRLSKLTISTDTAKRLLKIREGVVYNDITTFIDELIQNAQRAKATIVKIYANENTFSIIDNGYGCDNPKDLFTLDVSGFGIGFGEGFNSIYTVADWFEIETLDWKSTKDIKEGLRKNDLEVIPIENPFYQGFKVKLKGEKIECYINEIIKKSRSICSLIPNIEFYVNDEIVCKKDIFQINPEYKFYQRFSNSMYEGKIALTTHGRYNNIEIYSEYRHVMSLPAYGATGVILLKPNAVNLRVPDRKSIIYDEKRTKLENMIHKDVIYLVSELLKDSDSDTIASYAEIIECYLSVKEYIKYLSIGKYSIANQYDTRRKINKDETIDNEKKQDEVMVNKEKIEQDVKDADKNNTHNESKPNYQPDTKRQKDDQHFSSFVTPNNHSVILKSELEKVNIKNIKQKKNVVWVEKNQVSDKSDLISKYEYYGIFTFISPHILYDKALKFMDIPHIDSVQDQSIEKVYEVTRTGSLTKKEERIMELLEFIETQLHLPRTFYISDIKCKKIVSLRGSKIYQENITVHGYAQNGTVIHLNRKSLNYGKINSILLGRDTIGIHDVRFILSNINLISHELAHIIYNTEDNTKEHYKREAQLTRQIGEIFLNRENIFS